MVRCVIHLEASRMTALRVLVVAALATSFGGPVEAQAPRTCGIVHMTVLVDARNDEWTSASVTVDANDRVFVSAPGKIKVGKFVGEVSADGNTPTQASSLGRLEMKVGAGTVHSVGKRWAGEAEAAGPLKFRVRDSNYADNGGGFEVDVIVIPPTAVPPPVLAAGS